MSVDRKSTAGTIGAVPTGPFSAFDAPGPDGKRTGPVEAVAIPSEEPGDPPAEPSSPLVGDFGESSRMAMVARLARAIVTTAIQTNEGPPHPPHRQPPPALGLQDADRIRRA
jgi:hypothetical protein